jgi:hypothetical protein
MSSSVLGPVLDRLFDPVGRALNREAAEKLVQLRADAKTQAKIDKLAAKCNEGRLSAAEREQYETYVVAIDVVAVLQAKARAFLARGTKDVG